MLTETIFAPSPGMDHRCLVHVCDISACHSKVACHTLAIYAADKVTIAVNEEHSSLGAAVTSY